MFLIQWSSPHQPISPPHHPPFFFLFLFSSFFSFLRAIKVIKIQMTVNHTLSKTQHSSNMKFSPTHQSLHSHLSDSCHKGDHPLAITSPKDDHTLSDLFKVISQTHATKVITYLQSPLLKMITFSQTSSKSSLRLVPQR